MATGQLERRTVEIRGRTEPIEVIEVIVHPPTTPRGSCFPQQSQSCSNQICSTSTRTKGPGGPPGSQSADRGGVSHMVGGRHARLVVKERQQWLGRVRGPDGRQKWIKATDLRPAKENP
jgi:hypothetical protein